MANERYIFWILDWGSNPVYSTASFSPVKARCEIDHNKLALFTPTEEIIVPLDQIIEASEYHKTVVRGGNIPPNLRLKLQATAEIRKSVSQTAQLFLLPAGVLENPPTFSRSEVQIMIEAIEAFQNHREPTSHPNPYYRALQRSGKLDEFSENKWSAKTPPHVYTPVMSVWKFTIYIIGIVLAVCITLIFIAVIANLIFKLISGV